MKSNKLSYKNYELSVQRNLLSNQRTYLASIRTTSIFAGLAILMLEKGKSKYEKLSVSSILILCIIVNTYSSYNYYNTVVKEEGKHYSSLVYAVLLNIILFLILIHLKTLS
jgi:uncharacterized membrane protein YidH (DUF202 family)